MENQIENIVNATDSSDNLINADISLQERQPTEEDLGMAVDAESIASDDDDSADDSNNQPHRPSSTTSSSIATSNQQNYNPNLNKATSCYHCRHSHIGCDKRRPCGRCVRLGRECIEYDKSLPKPLGIMGAGNAVANQLGSSSGPFSSSSSPALTQNTTFYSTGAVDMPSGLICFDEVVPNATAFRSSTLGGSNTGSSAETSSSNTASNSSPAISTASQQVSATPNVQSSSGAVDESDRDSLLKSLPCHGCRQAHVACDRGRPCSRCVRQGIPCQDQTSHRLLGQKAGGMRQSGIGAGSAQYGGQQIDEDYEYTRVPTLAATVPPIDPRLLYMVGPSGWMNSAAHFAQGPASAAFIAEKTEPVKFTSDQAISQPIVPLVEPFGFARNVMSRLDSEYFVDNGKSEKDKALFAYPSPAVTPPPTNAAYSKEIGIQTDPFEPEVGEILWTSTFAPRFE